jgi:ABC-type multidrug transport system fused ATPase/permease subunit
MSWVSRVWIGANDTDISRIPLHQLRSKIGIISQDPILLSETLRLNLDIDGSHSDDVLYNALHQVQLIDRTKMLDIPNGPTSSTSSASSTTGTDITLTPNNVNIFANLDTEIKNGGDK